MKWCRVRIELAGILRGLIGMKNRKGLNRRKKYRGKERKTKMKWAFLIGLSLLLGVLWETINEYNLWKFYSIL